MPGIKRVNRGRVGVFHMSVAKKLAKMFTSENQAETPGCLVGVIKDGSLIYQQGFGMADIERKLPITTESPFYIASTSKQFTAACILLLAKRGELSVTDPINRYFPELPAYSCGITIAHLLHHTSGLRDYLTLKALAGSTFQESFGNQDALSILLRQQELNYPPGSEYLYTNSGYILLAEIVRRVSGKSLAEFAEESIFSPLGMKNTFFDDGTTSDVACVVSYQERKGGYSRLDRKFRVVGDGGIITTLEDLLLWDRDYYQHKLGDEWFYREFEKRGTLNAGETTNYAAGLTVGRYKGLPTLSHPGAMLGFSTQLLRFPKQKFTVIILANLSSIDCVSLAYQVADLYLASEYTLDDYVGQYYSPDLDSTYQVGTDDMDLQFIHERAPQGRFQCIGYDKYKVLSIEIGFHRDDQDQITGFTLNTPRARNLIFCKS